MKWQQNELVAQLKEEMVGKRGEIIKTGTGISDLSPTESSQITETKKQENLGTTFLPQYFYIIDNSLQRELHSLLY